jgi:type II secretory pathway pseudopilin PulG
MAKSQRMHRVSGGSTLVELLVVTLVSALLSTLALSALVVCVRNSNQISSRVEVNETLERTLERIGREIRAGESLGDVYHAPGQGEIAQCSNSTLVVQVPITDANGFNTFLNDTDATGNVTKRPNVETLVYEVVPHPVQSGVYQLKWTRYPGAAVAGYKGPTSIKRQVMLNNIIGPLDRASGKPKIFQYIDSADSSGTVRDTIDITRPNDFRVVVVNMESRKNNAKGQSLETIGLKAEYYLHNSGK